MMAGLKKWTSISEKTPNHKSKVRFLQFVCFSQEINSCFLPITLSGKELKPVTCALKGVFWELTSLKSHDGYLGCGLTITGAMTNSREDFGRGAQCNLEREKG